MVLRARRPHEPGQPDRRTGFVDADIGLVVGSVVRTVSHLQAIDLLLMPRFCVGNSVSLMLRAGSQALWINDNRDPMNIRVHGVGIDRDES